MLPPIAAGNSASTRLACPTALLTIAASAHHADATIEPRQQARGQGFAAVSGDAATALVRVVDLVRGPGGGEQVHWIPVPPHLATAQEAVAWTFHKGPVGCAPQQES